MATDTSVRRGILSEERRAEREQLIEMLTRAYWMEIETVMSYIANSINPDGKRAQEIIESLEEDIQEELGHARVASASASSSSMGWCRARAASRPSRATCSPRGADRHRSCDQGRDRGRVERSTTTTRSSSSARAATPVTQDMVIEILADEEGHRRLFEGFLREYEAEGLA